MSNYLIGDDIYAEYHAFQVTSQNLHWGMGAWHNNVMATLSVSILPAIFQSILRINPVYIYKLVFLLPISLTPVIGYLIYKKYVGHLYGFLSSFFFIAQFPFIHQLTHHMRIGVAMIAFSLAIMVLFDDHLTGLNKRILFLIFLLSVVVMYYVMPILFLFMLIVLWLVPKISKGVFGSQTLSNISVVLLSSVLIFFWWSQVAGAAFSSYVYFGKQTLDSLSAMFIGEFRGGNVTSLYTIPSASFLQQVPGMIQRIVFVVVGIGVVSVLMKKEQRVRFSGYAILMGTCSALLAGMIILPYLSVGYSASRLYLQVLVVLAPAFILGCQVISDGINAARVYFTKRVRFIARNYVSRYTSPGFNLTAILIGLILIGQFLSASCLYNQLLGFPAREILDRESAGYKVFYVYDSEVLAAEWLGENYAENLRVYMGHMAYPRLGDVFEYTDYGVNRKFDVCYFQKAGPIPDSYVFLRHFNVVGGQVNSPVLESVPTPEGTLTAPPLTAYAYYFADRNKIYANGDAEIYR